MPERKAQGSMWFDELAVFLMICCALGWALLNRERPSLLASRAVRRAGPAGRQPSRDGWPWGA